MLHALGAMQVSELEYELPEHLIAQSPVAERDSARLLCVNRKAGTHERALDHGLVRDLPGRLPPCLVIVNDTRVIPARLWGHKPSGGRVELLLVERLEAGLDRQRWLAWGRASKGLQAGSRVSLAAGLEAEVLGRREGPIVEIELRLSETAGPPRSALRSGPSVDAAIERAGVMPLPPYIRRGADAGDSERYQTMFAAQPGAVAAPTAGLHFTPSLVAAMEAAGHRLARVTLHVGPGTFAPLRVDDLTQHIMHAERYEIPESTVADIEQAKREGRPVLAIGTTVVRTLEAAARDDGMPAPGVGRTDICLYPPYHFRVVDALLTNFHLPRSTLLALVMAFGGVERVRCAYATAVAENYRFFSYGDAMLLYDGL